MGAALNIRSKERVEQHEFWHARYRDAPGEFFALPRPVSAPTEWPVLAFLHALRHGDVTPLTLTSGQTAAAGRAAGWLRQITGLMVPSLSITTWHPGSEAASAFRRASPDCRGFALCAEPQLRTNIVLCPDLIGDLDDRDFACLIVHETMHCANALAADPEAGVYLRPLASRLEEACVGFVCDLVIRSLLHDSRVFTRDAFEKEADSASEQTDRRWLAALLDLTRGDTVSMCHELAGVAYLALSSTDDAGLADDLDERSGHRRGLDGWLGLLDDTSTQY